MENSSKISAKLFTTMESARKQVRAQEWQDVMASSSSDASASAAAAESASASAGKSFLKKHSTMENVRSMQRANEFRSILSK